MKRLLGLYFVFLLICPMAHASSVLDANTFASCPLCYEDKLTGQKSINAFWGSTQNGLRIAIQLTLFCDDERTPMAPEMRVFAAEAGAAPFEVASLQIFIDDHVYAAANLYTREESAYFFCELGPHGRSMLNRLASTQAITLHLSCRDERGKPFFL